MRSSTRAAGASRTCNPGRQYLPIFLAPISVFLRENTKLPTFHPEFGRFMLEATPGRPWGIGFKDLLSVESDMKLRRVIAKKPMAANQYPITLTTFPRLGTKDDFIQPYYPPSGPAL